MTVPSLTRTIVLTLLTSVTSWTGVAPCYNFEDSVCKIGWFGSSCQYRCRCEGYACTGRHNGTCQRGYKCQGGWFGPECQYVDLAYNNTNLATDGRDETCVSRQTEKIFVPLNKTFPSYRFTWLRIHLKQSWTAHFLRNLKIDFIVDQTYDCINARNSTVDKHTIDVHCDLPDTVHSVTLQGPAVSYLCSVYVSGGRSLALGQTTVQSSTQVHLSSMLLTMLNLKPLSSGCAVDGETTERPHTCSLTSSDDRNPSWKVQLTHSFLVDRYVIYTGQSMHNKQYVLTLEGRDRHGSIIFSFQDTSGRIKMVNPITSNNWKSPVSAVLVKTSVSGSQENVLHLCEVELYGDTSCQSGFYGRECQHRCNCRNNSECFISTGGCPASCAEGYQGEDCRQACNKGKYGHDCEQSCSVFCTPSDDCEVSPCNHITGSCLFGCLPGYLEPDCVISCHAGQYGRDCQSNCSELCTPANTSMESSCSHVDGSCLFGCLHGYLEPDCVIKQDVFHVIANDLKMLMMVSGVLITVIILLAFALVCILRKKSLVLARDPGSNTGNPYENDANIISNHIVETAPVTKDIESVYTTESSAHIYASANEYETSEGIFIYSNMEAED